MTEDLITWLRQIWDDQRTELEQLLAEYLGTHPEHGIRLQLDEVNAKLRILDEYEDYAHDDADDHEQAQFAADAALALKAVVHLLAQPYAGQPGWQEEWAA